MTTVDRKSHISPWQQHQRGFPFILTPCLVNFISQVYLLYRRNNVTEFVYDQGLYIKDLNNKPLERIALFQYFKSMLAAGLFTYEKKNYGIDNTRRSVYRFRDPIKDNGFLSDAVHLNSLSPKLYRMMLYMCLVALNKHTQITGRTNLLKAAGYKGNNYNHSGFFTGEFLNYVSVERDPNNLKQKIYTLNDLGQRVVSIVLRMDKHIRILKKRVLK